MTLLYSLDPAYATNPAELITIAGVRTCLAARDKTLWPSTREGLIDEGFDEYTASVLATEIEQEKPKPKKEPKDCYQKRRRERLKAAGVCTECAGKKGPVMEGRLICRPCREHDNILRIAQRKRKLIAQ